MRVIISLEVLFIHYIQIQKLLSCFGKKAAKCQHCS